MKSTERPTARALWLEAEAARVALEQPLAGSSPPAAAVQHALALYAECARALDNHAVFSANETMGDLPTTVLPLLALDFHVAALVLRMPVPAPALSPRRAALSAARAALKRFLNRLDAYGLQRTSYAAQYSRYAEESHSTSASTAVFDEDAAIRRHAKIATFRAEKVLRNRVDALRHAHGADNEVERDLRLAELALHAHLALQELESISREEEILLHAPSTEPPPRMEVEADEARERPRRLVSNADAYSERLDTTLLKSGGALFAKDGRPLRPFTLVAKSRNELRRSVFRPGHHLPTISIDEFLAEERRRGGIIDGGGTASLRPLPAPDGDDYAVADAENIKARQWDEFKEENPRGSGNTLNRG